jgi:hypothetical protein
MMFGGEKLALYRFFSEPYSQPPPAKNGFSANPHSIAHSSCLFKVASCYFSDGSSVRPFPVSEASQDRKIEFGKTFQRT